MNDNYPAHGTAIREAAGLKASNANAFMTNAGQ